MKLGTTLCAAVLLALVAGVVGHAADPSSNCPVKDLSQLDWSRGAHGCGALDWMAACLQLSKQQQLPNFSPTAFIQTATQTQSLHFPDFVDIEKLVACNDAGR